MNNQADNFPDKMRTIVIGIGQSGEELIPGLRATPQTINYQVNPFPQLEAYPYGPNIKDKLGDQAMVFLVGAINHPDFNRARELILNHTPFFLWSIGTLSQGSKITDSFQIDKREGLILSRDRDALTLIQSIYQGHCGGIMGYDSADTVHVCGGHELGYAWIEAIHAAYGPALEKLFMENGAGLLQARAVILFILFKRPDVSLTDIETISDILRSSSGPETVCYMTDGEVPGMVPEFRALFLTS